MWAGSSAGLRLLSSASSLAASASSPGDAARQPISRSRCRPSDPRPRTRWRHAPPRPRAAPPGRPRAGLLRLQRFNGPPDLATTSLQLGLLVDGLTPQTGEGPHHPVGPPYDGAGVLAGHLHLDQVGPSRAVRIPPPTASMYMAAESRRSRCLSVTSASRVATRFPATSWRWRRNIRKAPPAAGRHAPPPLRPPPHRRQRPRGSPPMRLATRATVERSRALMRPGNARCLRQALRSAARLRTVRPWDRRQAPGAPRSAPARTTTTATSRRTSKP